MKGWLKNHDKNKNGVRSVLALGGKNHLIKPALANACDGNKT